MVLEAFEHHPAMHVRQAQVQGDGVGLDGLGQFQRRFAMGGDEPLDALLVGHVEQDIGELGVVLDDQDHMIARANDVAVASHLGPGHGGNRRRGAAIAVAAGNGFGSGREGKGQVERKGASLAGRAGHADLAAQKSGDFAADRQAKTGAAEAAAGAHVGLLERLEDDLELIGRDADARVVDGKTNHFVRAVERFVIRAPAALDRDDG